MSAVLPDRRTSGVLLHPTSLPGPTGIGDLGPQAHAWVDTLARARQSWWQMLPVGPTGYGDSPYQSPSTFAGNPNLLSPERLADDGLCNLKDLTEQIWADGSVNYDQVVPHKQQLVRWAWERFRAGDGQHLRPMLDAFRSQSAWWLDDYALFAAIKDSLNGIAWWQWPRSLAFRDHDSLKAIAERLADEIDAHRFGQFLFFHQWGQLREHAQQSGIQLIGDLPVYVAQDSADVWARPEFFLLNEERQPVVVAGVPPDYFSATGQLWGNPIYDWDALKKTGYSWWVARLQAALNLFDLVRIDHFRGLEAYWAIPAGDTTAEHGRWVAGPGEHLLEALRTAVGGLPIIAEDLGFITPQVDALREQFALPGMRILQFAFGGAVEARFLPHRFGRNLVVYTGTHDNDTTRGWYEKLTDAERNCFHHYAPDAAAHPVGALVRLAWASVANLAVVPLQDLLGFGSDARVNKPGTATGNWCWRVSPQELLTDDWAGWLADLGRIYERNKE
jgi:4-alpha-glucanotransferase